MQLPIQREIVPEMWRLSLTARSIRNPLKYMAGYRVTFSAQHIHGGIGVDREYPVHRYYVYARHLELVLGGSTHHLRRLGKLIAENAA